MLHNKINPYGKLLREHSLQKRVGVRNRPQEIYLPRWAPAKRHKRKLDWVHHLVIRKELKRPKAGKFATGATPGCRNRIKKTYLKGQAVREKKETKTVKRKNVTGVNRQKLNEMKAPKLRTPRESVKGTAREADRREGL